jgi:hypothetical protein
MTSDALGMNYMWTRGLKEGATFIGATDDCLPTPNHATIAVDSVVRHAAFTTAP